MRRTLTLMLLLLMCAPLWAQEQETDNTDYTRRYNKLYKSYVKNPNDVEVMMEMAQFYADTDNPMFDLASAMRFISNAESEYVAIVEDRDRYKEGSKLIKKKITVATVRQTRQRIVNQARGYIDRSDDLSEATLNSLAQVFSNDASTLQLIESKRLLLRYRNAIGANTLGSYRDFYDSYASTAEGEDVAKRMSVIAAQMVASAQTEAQVDQRLEGYLDIKPVNDEAQKRKSAIAYRNLMRNPTTKACREFLTKYPGSNEHALVQARIDETLRKEFQKLSTPRQLADFADQNADNPLADEAIARLKQMITDERNMEAYSIYMDEFPLDVSYNEIYMTYFNWHTEEGNKAPIDLFASQNPDFPYQIAVAQAQADAAKYDSINVNINFNEKQFSQWASKIYHLTGKKESFVALQRTLQQYIASKKWDKIPARLEYFSLSFEDNCQAEVAELRSIIERPVNTMLTPATVVRPAYDMLHPVMHPDGKRLYFNRMVGGQPEVNIAELSAGKKGGAWQRTGAPAFTNIENRGVQIYNFFDNGNKMLIGQGGDIMIATKEGDGWTVSEVLPASINSQYNDFDAFMLPDGSGILFASDRPGGQNLQPSRSYFHGDTALASDIYYAPCHNGQWGDAVNLGIGINSPYMECSPCLSDDMKTLYFVTDGRGGLGYGDIYYATRDNVSDWTHWSEPTNYGKEVNSGYREMSVTPLNAGHALLIGSNAGGHYGCSSVAARHTLNDIFTPVEIVADETGFTAEIVNAATLTTVNPATSIQRLSSATIPFYADQVYLLYAHCSGLFIPSVRFTPSQTRVVAPIAYTAQQLSDATSTEGITLHGIIFENNRSTLAACSMTEIKSLAQFLKSNPGYRLEIMAHVEGHDDTYCYNMSLSRAAEVKNQLSYQGVDPDSIVTSAYGNSKTKSGAKETSIEIRLQHE